MAVYQYFRLFSCLLICLISTAGNSKAQDEVSVQFVSFPIVSAPQPVELLVGEGKTLSVELPTNSLSPVYRVSRLPQWILGKSSTDKEGKPTFVTYGQTASISSAKQLILVIRKGIKDSDGYDLIPLSGGDGGLSGGKYFLFNAAKVAVAGELGTSKFALEPRKHILLAPKPSEVNGNRKYLFTTLYYRKGKEAQPFYTSTWRLSERARSMVFIYHDPHTSQLRMHTIRNYIE